MKETIQQSSARCLRCSFTCLILITSGVAADVISQPLLSWKCWHVFVVSLGTAWGLCFQGSVFLVTKAILGAAGLRSYLLGPPCLDTALFCKHAEPLFRFHIILCFVWSCKNWVMRREHLNGGLSVMMYQVTCISMEKILCSLVFKFLRKCFTLKNWSESATSWRWLLKKSLIIKLVFNCLRFAHIAVSD